MDRYLIIDFKDKVIIEKNTLDFENDINEGSSTKYNSREEFSKDAKGAVNELLGIAESVFKDCN